MIALDVCTKQATLARKKKKCSFASTPLSLDASAQWSGIRLGRRRQATSAMRLLCAGRDDDDEDVYVDGCITMIPFSRSRLLGGGCKYCGRAAGKRVESIATNMADIRADKIRILVDSKAYEKQNRSEKLFPLARSLARPTTCCLSLPRLAEAAAAATRSHTIPFFVSLLSL